MSTDPSNSLLQERLARLKIGEARKHFFLCLGGKCCSFEDGAKSWEHLKSRLREEQFQDRGILRTGVKCLRVCQKGPVGLVYPEGTWYHSLTPQHIDQVLAEDLLQNKPVEALKLTSAPLPTPK